MQFSILSSVAALSTLLAQASALGINCRGSSGCTGGAVGELNGYVQQVQCERLYKDGEHIACSSKHSGWVSGGGTCVFLQSSGGGAYGSEIMIMMQAIVDHGCDECGSVPVTFPVDFGDNNDPSNGILTVNYVHDTDNPCPPGLC